MKKTLVALAVTAFATSASALTIYEADGSKVVFDGSIRMRLDNEKSVEKRNGVKKVTQKAHTNLHNDGTRFNIAMSHQLGEDLYSFGRLEFRFNGDSKGTDKFGDLFTNKAYVGIGSHKFGEVAFGRQATIGDEIYQADFEYAYGVFDTTLSTSGRSVIRYDYKGIEGLHIGLDYRFAEHRDNKGEVIKPNLFAGSDDYSSLYPLKSGYGVGALYEFPKFGNQTVRVGAGYTRDNFESSPDHQFASHHRDAWGATAKYAIDDLEVAIDYSGQFLKEGSKKDKINGFRVGALYNVTDKIALYGSYGYLKNNVDNMFGDVVKNVWSFNEQGKAQNDPKHTNEDNYTTERTERHKFMLGTSYRVHKNVVTYLEGSIENSKETYSSDTKRLVKKIRNTNVGVGLRVFW
ncbi:porin [Otariodibacter sp.]|uniref:porin n=1 Tax=Otariodibacter sp. TaxID=3030919 RepID=UPI0026307892|nr:porin [Otariodibacter sp.]